MEGKLVQSLFEHENIDHKNILNRSSVVIPQSILDEIESEGITSERLDTLGVPVFKYKTQITIHGLFPELKENYLAGYKNLFQNKNLSIGIKYNGVDSEKKSRVYKMISRYSRIIGEKVPWMIHHDSTSWYAFKFTMIPNLEKVQEYLPEMKIQIDNLNDSSFFGTKHIGVYRNPLFGGYYIQCSIKINAIYENQISNFVSSLFSKPYEEIENEIEIENAKLKAEEEAKKAEEKAEIAEFNRVAGPIRKEFIEKLLAKGFRKLEVPIPIQNDLKLLTFHVSSDFQLGIEVRVFGKKSNQKKWRVFEYDITESEIENDFPMKFDYSCREWSSATVKGGWLFPEKKKVVAEEIKVNSNLNCKMVPYKSGFVLMGSDTIKIKDELRKLGGWFNYRYDCGPGWFFKKEKENEIVKLLNKN